jgi:hypothetical protein
MTAKPNDLSSMIFKRIISPKMGETTLTAQMLSILPEFDGIKKAGEIMAITGINGVEFKDAINKLYKLKLIEKVGPNDSAPVLSRNFFIQMNSLLARSLGPISSKILKETIKSQGEVPEKFPVLKGDVLISIVAEKIYNENEKQEFITAMKKSLNTFL